jgi:uncharacterized protein YndB with AHSA1/START domain
MNARSLWLTTGAVLLAANAWSSPADRILRAELTIEAPVVDVWNAWTTEEGVKTFFAPGAHLEPRVDGAYEIFFNPQGEPGMRGGDGMRFLSYEKERRLAVTWNAPPSLPEMRAQRTIVVVDFASSGSRRTALRFTHLGWGDGPEWDKAYAYFDHAWSAVVLPRLVERFKTGPIDWSRPPQLAPVASTLQQQLRPSEASAPVPPGSR